MTAKISEAGLLIPKELLGSSTEFEIRREGRSLVVEPLEPEVPLTDEEIANDPIWDLGKNPADIDVTDGSVNHDRYFGET